MGYPAKSLELGQTPERRDLPVHINAAFLKKPPVGSKVYIVGNFRADEGEKWAKHEMTLNGSDYEAVVPDLQVGATYEYKFIIIPPDGSEGIWIPTGGPETNRQLKVQPEAPISPSPDVPETEVRASVREGVKSILESSRSREGAESLHELFELLRHEIDALNIKDDVTPILLEVTAEVISGLPDLPHAIKSRFAKGTPPVKSFDDLKARMAQGAELYQRRVWLALRADPEAFKALQMDKIKGFDPVNPLGDSHLNRIFSQECARRDLSHMAPQLGEALRSVGNVPERARNPKLAEDRRRMLDGVISRMSPAKRNALSNIPQNRQAFLLSAAVQGGAYLVSGFGAILFANGLKQLSGISEKDVVEVWHTPSGRRDLGELWKVFLRNNIVTKSFTTKGRVLDLWKARAKRWLLESIPGYGAVKFAGKPIEEESTAEATSVTSQAETSVSTETLIAKACESALGKAKAA